MRVALVHDWLNGLRGGERCLDTFLAMYPEADVYTLLHQPGTTTERIDTRLRETSFLQRLPGVQRYYRMLLPLYPRAVRGFSFDGYDLVISLSHAAAKNIVVPQHIPHICYCFTPMRYIWDQAYHYFGASTGLLWPVIKRLRLWDHAASQNVTCLVGISNFVAARIRCFYKRHAEVIYPPVDTSWIKPARQTSRGEAFLYAGALVPYKRPDLVIEAFNRLGEALWVVGDGPELGRLRKQANSNINFFGRVSDDELATMYAHCRALVFPGTEDFGMIPVECLAAGRPVVGYYHGGLRETLTGLKSWENSQLEPQLASGVFFRSRGGACDVSDLIEGLKCFIEHESEFSAASCIAQAARFSPSRFYSDWLALLERLAIRSDNVVALSFADPGSDVQDEVSQLVSAVGPKSIGDSYAKTA